MKKIDLENKINKYYVIVGSICIALVIVLLVISIRENTKQSLVQNGILEHTEIVTGYIIKKEVTILKDQNKVLVPIISEGERVSKNDIVATYKGEEYKNYEQTLSRMDKEILERMQELPAVYSSEVNAIEKTIYSLVKQSMGENSYNKMQDYKQKINANINKRANIIGELSPEGAEIRTLIEERNQYEKSAKNSNDNILAPMPGIVSYTVDGIEEKINYSNILDIDYDTLQNTITNQKNADNTKIKIVNNYEAYIVIKASLDNLNYIEEDYEYRLRLIEQDNFELIGNVEKVNVLEDGIEVYFKVTNGIENIVNLRVTELEIVWDYSTGLIIPSKALNKFENSELFYVKTIKYSEYENIPVIVRIQNENYALVKNYTQEQLQELNLTCEYDLKLYDRIILESKK